MSTPFPFDPSGSEASNRIEGEVHTISSPNGDDFILVIPDFGPFFPDDGKGRFTITQVSTGNPLILGVDFLYTHRFASFNNTYPDKEVYGSFILADTEFTGDISINYNTIGGEYTLSETQITTLLASALTDPRTTSWDSLTNVPALFDPITHQHETNQFIGWGDAVAVLAEIRDVLTNAYSALRQLYLDHIADSDPHKPKQITVAESATEFVIGGSYLLTETGTYTLPQLEETKDGETIKVKAYFNVFPTIQVEGTYSETIEDGQMTSIYLDEPIELILRSDWATKTWNIN